MSVPSQTLSSESQSDEKKELEEMTIAEIGCEIPKIEISDGMGTIADVFKSSMSINQKIHYSAFYDQGTLLNCVLNMIVEFDNRKIDSSEFNILQEYALKIIQTTHCKHKKGCDIVHPTQSHAENQLSSIPLRIISAWRRRLSSPCPTSKVRFIIKALIEAGANFNTFDLSLVPMRLRAKAPFDLSTVFSDISHLTTPLDEMMYGRHNNLRCIDFYSMSKWDPTQDIPSDFKEPLFRLILKTIYQHAELVADAPSMRFKALIDFFEKPDMQDTNVFRNPINALIFSYIKPKIDNVESLSCFKRPPLFYQNIIYIGKQFCMEDQMKEMEKQKSQELERQKGQELEKTKSRI